jgi:cysteine sulfinate desulfinase/cysteine desulfurase/selenocysteine lyase
VLGTVNPVALLISAAHAVGAKVLIDGAQAAAHIKLDLKALDADFYVFSGHKLYGPTGVGVLYGKLKLLEAMPPWQAGGEMIERVAFNGTTFQDPPFRFEAGTPHIAGAIGLGAAIKWLEDHDHDSLIANEAIAFHDFDKMLRELPELIVIGSNSSRLGAISFNVSSANCNDIGTFLDLAGIAVRAGHHCCQPLMQRYNINGTIRVSTSCFNGLEEVKSLERRLKEIIVKFLE